MHSTTELKTLNLKMDHLNCVVCDDELTNARAIANLITNIATRDKKSANVVICLNGFECLNRIYEDYKKGIRCDLLFIDENMPGIKGSVAIKILKDLMNSKELNLFKMYSISCFENEEIKISLLKIGCDGFLPKPVNKKTLEELFNIIHF